MATFLSFSLSFAANRSILICERKREFVSVGGRQLETTTSRVCCCCLCCCYASVKRATLLPLLLSLSFPSQPTNLTQAANKKHSHTQQTNAARTQRAAIVHQPESYFLIASLYNQHTQHTTRAQSTSVYFCCCCFDGWKIIVTLKCKQLEAKLKLFLSRFLSHFLSPFARSGGG